MSIDDLDELLKHLYENQNFALFEDIQAGLNKDTFPLLAMLNKLEKDGYVTKKYGVLRKSPDDFFNKPEKERKVPSYLISFEGVLFFENTPKNFLGRPYRAGQNQQIQNQIWRSAKTMAVVANALIIIVIGCKTCQVSDKSNTLEKEKQAIQNKLDSCFKQ